VGPPIERPAWSERWRRRASSFIHRPSHHAFGPGDPLPTEPVHDQPDIGEGDDPSKVPVRFTAYRGLFLLHCHNLEQEDVRMMINVLVW